MICNIITYEAISLLARPCSADKEMAEAFIAEAQRVEVKPRVGDALYMAISDDAPGGRFCVLLNGGKWTDCRGGARYLTGLKTALAYYALARIVRDGNIQASTYGAVVKDDQYSAEAEKAERQRQYRELFSQADSYMAEVLDYLESNRDLFPEYQCKASRKNNRIRFKVIG